MSFEAIVLAGGLGTRLRSVTGDLPKVMVNVAGRPFLEYVLDGLVSSGVRRVILAVGYQNRLVREHFRDRYRELPLIYSIEETQLGTGGAVLHAIRQTSSKDVLVLNGDTWVDIDHAALMDVHRAQEALWTMAVAPVSNCSRFGTVQIVDGRVTAFHEKGRAGPGLINAGVRHIFRAAAERRRERIGDHSRFSRRSECGPSTPARPFPG